VLALTESDSYGYVAKQSQPVVIRDVGCADAGSASCLARKMRFLRQHILREIFLHHHGRYWLPPDVKLARVGRNNQRALRRIHHHKSSSFKKINYKEPDYIWMPDMPIIHNQFVLF
jgi:hypothetical protein